MEVIGWIGSICFSMCAMPQAWQSWKQKHSDGVNFWFLCLWTVGEVCMIIYTLPMKSLPLTVNYLFNLLCLLVIIHYRNKSKNGI